MVGNVSDAAQAPQLVVEKDDTNKGEPYVGPRPFQSADRDIFFGRQHETIELTSLIKAHPGVLLYAQSGAGKTSLIYAQLIPALDVDEEFDVLPPARVRAQHAVTIPDEKIRNVYVFNALGDLSEGKLSPIERAQMTLAEYLRRRPRPPVRNQDQDDQEELRLARAVIFDQFEEIFTLHPERYKDRQDFFGQIAEALQADPYLRVLFSMREDYIAELDPYIDLLPQKLGMRFRLERLRKQSALAAVTKPLKAARARRACELRGLRRQKALAPENKPLQAARMKNAREFSPAAANSLVESLMMIKVKTASGEKKEVLGEFVDPVQLQVVCQTLWDKLPPAVRVITKRHLQKYANVEEALLNFYENSVRKAVEAANKAMRVEAEAASQQGAPHVATEDAVRVWFERVLITREGKRNMVFRGHDKTGGLRNEVVTELEDRHLIRAEMRGGEPWYELSHDRFIVPIKESNQRWIRQQPLLKRKAQELEARAAEWIDSKRDDSLLLDRSALADAKKWVDSPQAEAIGFSNELHSLIRESAAAIEREDNKQLLSLAAEQQLRLKAERQRSRQFRFGLVLASLLLIVALGAAIKAHRAEVRAEANEVLAKNNLAKALVSEREARNNFEEANRAKATVEEEKLKVEDEARQKEEEKKKAEAARDEASQEKVKALRAKAEAQLAQRAAETAKTQLESKNIELHQQATALTTSEKKAWSLTLASYAAPRLPDDSELSMRLALEALDKQPSNQAKFILRQAYLKSKEHYILRGPADISTHKNAEVTQVMYSHSGKFMVTAGSDGIAKIWDTEKWDAQQKAEPKILKGHKAAIHALDISPDDTRIATEAGDGTGRIWWPADGRSVELKGLNGPISALSFSPDGKLLATEAGTEEGPGASPKLWDAETGEAKFTLTGHEDSVTAVAFPAKQGVGLVATASLDTTARVWSTQTGQEVAVLRGHTDKLNSVAFDPSGQLVVTGSSDGTARVWVAKTGEPKLTLAGHIGVVRSAMFSPNGKLIVTVGGRKDLDSPEDNTVRIWAAPSGRLVTILGGHTKEIRSTKFSRDGELIVTSGMDGTARVWVAETGEFVKEVKHEPSVLNAAFNHDSSSVVTAGEDGTAHVWKMETNPRTGFFMGSGELRGARSRFSPDGKKIISVGTDGSITRWELESKKKSVDYVDLKKTKDVSRYQDAAISPDERFIVTGSGVPSFPAAPCKGDNNAHVWDVKGKKFIADLVGHTCSVTEVVWSPRGSYVLTVSSDRTARVWEASTWKLLWTLEPDKFEEDPGNIRGVAFDPGERVIATAQQRGTVHLWDLATRENVNVIRANKDSVSSVAFNAGGDLIVTASNDGTAAVLRLNGKRVTTFRQPTGRLNSAEFSADGMFVVTTGTGGTVRVWETETRAQVAEFRVPVILLGRQESELFTASLSPDNLTVVVTDSLGLVNVFKCETCRPIEEIKKLALETQPRDLTSGEKILYLEGDSKEPEEAAPLKH